MDCAIFWDIENVGIPSGVDPLMAAQALKSSVVDFAGGKLKSYLAIANIDVLSRKVRTGLQKASCDLADCISDKPSAADILLITRMWKFTLENPAPMVIAIVTGDGDFAQVISFLESQLYTVFLVHSSKNTSHDLVNVSSSHAIFQDIIRDFQGELNHLPLTPRQKMERAQVPPAEKSDSLQFHIENETNSLSSSAPEKNNFPLELNRRMSSGSLNDIPIMHQNSSTPSRLSASNPASGQFNMKMKRDLSLQNLTLDNRLLSPEIKKSRGVDTENNSNGSSGRMKRDLSLQNLTLKNRDSPDDDNNYNSYSNNQMYHHHSLAENYEKVKSNFKRIGKKSSEITNNNNHNHKNNNNSNSNSLNHDNNVNQGSRPGTPKSSRRKKRNSSPVPTRNDLLLSVGLDGLSHDNEKSDTISDSISTRPSLLHPFNKSSGKTQPIIPQILTSPSKKPNSFHRSSSQSCLGVCAVSSADMESFERLARCLRQLDERPYGPITVNDVNKALNFDYDHWKKFGKYMEAAEKAGYVTIHPGVNVGAETFTIPKSSKKKKISRSCSSSALPSTKSIVNESETSGTSSPKPQLASNGSKPQLTAIVPSGFERAEVLDLLTSEDRIENLRSILEIIMKQKQQVLIHSAEISYYLWKNERYFVTSEELLTLIQLAKQSKLLEILTRNDKNFIVIPRASWINGEEPAVICKPKYKRSRSSSE